MHRLSIVGLTDQIIHQRIAPVKYLEYVQQLELEVYSLYAPAVTSICHYHSHLQQCRHGILTVRWRASTSGKGPDFWLHLVQVHMAQSTDSMMLWNIMAWPSTARARA